MQADHSSLCQFLDLWYRARVCVLCHVYSLVSIVFCKIEFHPPDLLRRSTKVMWGERLHFIVALADTCLAASSPRVKPITRNLNSVFLFIMLWVVGIRCDRFHPLMHDVGRSRVSDLRRSCESILERKHSDAPRRSPSWPNTNHHDFFVSEANLLDRMLVFCLCSCRLAAWFSTPAAWEWLISLNNTSERG